MSRTFTAEELLERITLLVDDERFVLASREQYLSWIGVALSDLWVRLVDSMIYPNLVDQAVTTSGAATITLGANAFTVLRVERKNGERWYPLEQIHIGERHRWERDGTGDASRYIQDGDGTITLFPTPPSGKAYRVTYVAVPAKISSHTDVIDGIAGWDELIVLNVAIRAKLKEGSSVLELRSERNDWIAKLEHEKHLRNLDALRVPSSGWPLDSEFRYDSAWRRWR